MSSVQTVQELTTTIKTQLTATSVKRVRGVIGRITTAPSGHAYFEISDERTSARISCVMWTPSVPPKKAGLYEILPTRVDFYAPQGRAQLVVRECVPLEVIENVSQKARVLATLHSEGLTDRPRLPVPDIVAHMCIVTSQGSAAAHDMLKSIDERWPGLRTTLVHSLVQGDDAPLNLVRALTIANGLTPPADVIICGRGGGSEADLMAFDDERVARALASSPIPTVSAVGHENDHSVTDAVADVRSKTPTGAIELVLPISKAARVTELAELRSRLMRAVKATSARHRTIHQTTRDRLVRSTSRLISKEQERISLLRTSVENLISGTVALAAERVSSQRSELLRMVHRVRDDRRQFHMTRRQAFSLRVATLIDREASRLRACRKDLDAHAVPLAWTRGFFTLNKVGSSKRVRDLDSISEGEELCVRSHDRIISVIVRKCQRIN